MPHWHGACDRTGESTHQSNPNEPIKNKIVIVTGGTSGIGRATAIAFAAEGANVVIAGRRETEGAESAALVEKAGGRGLFVATDVADETSVAALVARTVEHFGRLDIAFNNAGVLFDQGPITGAAADMIDRTFAINVRGVALSMNTKSPHSLNPAAA